MLPTKYITSESVTEGHPDKLCDLVSDSILDAYLTIDPNAHVAVECMASPGLLVIAGEVAATGQIDIERVAREAIVAIGYDRGELGFDGHNCQILTNIHQQSPEIGQAVKRSLEARSGRGLPAAATGAGDQGLMYGYATNETPTLLPPTLFYAHQMAQRLTTVRKEGIMSYLRPDGKTQVTMSFDEAGEATAITGLVVSAQHEPKIPLTELQQQLLTHVVAPVVPERLITKDTKIYINPSGSFVEGGPASDTGLTGRKIIVDTYGGVVPHGGGAFSGKDATKVDRSAAYMARYVAKQIVAARLADKCQVSLSYAIGVAEPLSVSIETFGTAKVDERFIEEAVTKFFDFTPAGIIQTLSLRRPIYRETAAYGHFKAVACDLPWEQTDRWLELRSVLGA